MKASDNEFPLVQTVNAPAPATPAAGITIIYSKSDKLVYSKDDAGVETALGGGGGGGAMTLVATHTVSGSAVTSFTLSSLDLGADGSYYIIFSFGNATASAVVFSLFFNSDTTDTNYYNQTLAAFSTSPSAARQNNARIAEMAANSYVTGNISITKDISGRPRSLSITNRDEPNAIGLQYFSHVRTNTANVTDITISSSVVNAISIGSVFKVFKIS